MCLCSFSCWGHSVASNFSFSFPPSLSSFFPPSLSPSFSLSSLTNLTAANTINISPCAYGQEHFKGIMIMCGNRIESHRASKIFSFTRCCQITCRNSWVLGGSPVAHKEDSPESAWLPQLSNNTFKRFGDNAMESRYTCDLAFPDYKWTVMFPVVWNVWVTLAHISFRILMFFLKWLEKNRKYILDKNLFWVVYIANIFSLFVVCLFLLLVSSICGSGLKFFKLFYFFPLVFMLMSFFLHIIWGKGQVSFHLDNQFPECHLSVNLSLLYANFSSWVKAS